MCISSTQYITGAKAIITLLEEQNITHIFGYPGGANLPLYDELLNSPIQHVLARHEQGASHMADGFARVWKRAGVCLATSGPGATNLVTGLSTAMLDSIPLVAFTAQIARQFIGQDFFQEVDTVNITFPVTKHSELVASEKDLIPAVKNAFHVANTGRKGPVLLDIPTDILSNRYNYDFSSSISLAGYQPVIQGDKGQIKRAIRLLLDAKKPLLLFGGGVTLSHSQKELTSFINRLQIPSIRTLSGSGVLEETDDLFLGIAGTHGHKLANEAIQQADVILVLGARFSSRTMMNSSLIANAKIIHVDIDPAEIGKIVPVDIPIVGDLANVLTLFQEEVDKVIKKKKQEIKEAWRTVKGGRSSVLSTKDSALAMAWIFEEVSNLDVPLHITTDVGRHQVWANQCCTNPKHLPILSSNGLGTMGFGLPAAIGAWFADSSKSVINITGDGSFSMNMQELVVAVEHKVPLVVILINDQRLGMIRELQRDNYDERFTAHDFSVNVDFAKYAECVGATGITIETKEQIKPALEKALAMQSPVLLNCEIHKIIGSE